MPFRMYSWLPSPKHVIINTSTIHYQAETPTKDLLHRSLKDFCQGSGPCLSYFVRVLGFLIGEGLILVVTHLRGKRVAIFKCIFNIILICYSILGSAVIATPL